MSLPERGGDRVEKIVLGICAMDKKTVRHVFANLFARSTNFALRSFKRRCRAASR